MKYLYTPYDLAVFLIVSDFLQSYERKVLSEIWDNDKETIPFKYRRDKYLFIRQVYFELSTFVITWDDLDE